MIDPILPYPYAVIVCIVTIYVNILLIRYPSGIDSFPAVVLKYPPPKLEGLGINRPRHHVHPGVEISNTFHTSLSSAYLIYGLFMMSNAKTLRSLLDGAGNRP